MSLIFLPICIYPRPAPVRCYLTGGQAAMKFHVTLSVLFALKCPFCLQTAIKSESEMSQSFPYKTFVEQEITRVQRQVTLPCPFQKQMRLNWSLRELLSSIYEKLVKAKL